MFIIYDDFSKKIVSQIFNTQEEAHNAMIELSKNNKYYDYMILEITKTE